MNNEVKDKMIEVNLVQEMKDSFLDYSIISSTR